MKYPSWIYKSNTPFVSHNSQDADSGEIDIERFLARYSKMFVSQSEISAQVKKILVLTN